MDEGLSRAVREVFVRLYERTHLPRRLHHQLVPEVPHGPGGSGGGARGNGELPLLHSLRVQGSPRPPDRGNDQAGDLLAIRPLP